MFVRFQICVLFTSLCFVNRCLLSSSRFVGFWRQLFVFLPTTIAVDCDQLDYDPNTVLYNITATPSHHSQPQSPQPLPVATAIPSRHSHLQSPQPTPVATATPSHHSQPQSPLPIPVATDNPSCQVTRAARAHSKSQLGQVPNIWSRGQIPTSADENRRKVPALVRVCSGQTMSSLVTAHWWRTVSRSMASGKTGSGLYCRRRLSFNNFIQTSERKCTLNSSNFSSSNFSKHICEKISEVSCLSAERHRTGRIIGEKIV